MNQDVTWHGGIEAGLGSGDNLLDRDPASLRKKGHSPQFSAHVYCGQTAGWIKMPFGTEAGLGRGQCQAMTLVHAFLMF